MRKKILILLPMLWAVTVMANDIPLVYSVENTGADCTPPPLPTVNELAPVVRLPNPFEWSNGSGVMSSFGDWTCRRAEIKAEIENYEIGVKPNRPTDISAAYADGTLTVTIKENGQTVTLTSSVTLPTGTGPFPVIIGMNGATGSLSASLFTGCIQIPFMSGQVAGGQMGQGNRTANDPYFKMYPELYTSLAGHYSAWAWGVSRLIDGLELVKDQLNADLEHIGVTGCSYAGKMALFAGAFDERIALTIAQESGGGGTAAWRISETLGEVETLGATNYSWFMQSLKDNFAGKVDRLPYDHHELLAMIAPRALLALGNDGWVWMADESGYIACMAAREVWKFMGVEDRFGFDFTGGHMHCSAVASQTEAVTKFVDKFLHGKDDVDTNILTSPYQSRNVNYQFWMSDWADVTEPDVALEQNWFEAESESCAIIGNDLVIMDDVNASNGKYVTPKDGLNSDESVPDTQGLISIPFAVNNHRDFHIYFRVNCPSDSEGSFWVQIDNGPFVAYDGLNTNGNWEWVHIVSPVLLKGSHRINIGFHKDGVKLDRINITNNPTKQAPAGQGGEETICNPIPKYITLDFESGNINDWTKQNPGAGIDITQEDKHSGEYALKMVNGSGTSAWSVQAFSPSIEIVSGHKYKVSFWVRAVGGGGKGRVSTVSEQQLGSQYWNDFNVGDAWEQITYDNLTAVANIVRLAFDMGYIANKTYYIDDIVLENLTVEGGSGVTNVDMTPDVKIFSPVSGKIVVTTLENTKVRIIDIFGRTIKTCNVNNSSSDISLHSSGIYIVCVETRNKCYTQKIIVK